MKAPSTREPTKSVPTYCYNCVAGPDLMTVTVEDGVATAIRPNFNATEHPAQGRVCVKAYGLIEKTYNPHRIRTPMRRTNPNKGRGEDPGFVPITWDEALDAIGAKLNHVRATGLVDEAGLPRVAATFGHGPVDVLRRILDVAGLAVHAVLRVDLETLAAVVVVQNFVNAGRAIALRRLRP